MDAIFISYRRHLSHGWAVYLHQLLQRAFSPGEVFLDNENLHVGDYLQQLNDALAQCRVFVLVIGPQWLQVAGADGKPRLLDPTDVHRGEIETVLARKDVIVVPLLVDGARMPAEHELPASIAMLARHQALDLPGGGWRGASSRKRLLEEISDATGLPVSGLVDRNASPESEKSPEGATNRGRWWSAAKTVVAVLVATLLSTIATVVICLVVFGTTLTGPEIQVLFLGFLGVWSALAWWRSRRAQLPPGEHHA